MSCLNGRGLDHTGVEGMHHVILVGRFVSICCSILCSLTLISRICRQQKPQSARSLKELDVLSRLLAARLRAQTYIQSFIVLLVRSPLPPRR